ncbi:TPA: phosphate starvation-inducible protein PhoH [Candidatus Latescibacteria bacterium]|mgnify:FL=1|nr:phosphate starvation-inducible protein PhoH [Candidatus Latescibacterota bacterium]
MATDSPTLNSAQTSQRISTQGVDPLSLYGHNDANLIALESRYGVKITARGDTIRLDGDELSVRLVAGLIDEMISLLRRGDDVSSSDLLSAPAIPHHEREHEDEDDTTILTKKGAIRPRSERQADYISSVKAYDIVFGVGPAGTGKTYLAVACAIAALRRKEVSRIILTRPAVEAGESLGFLPGDIQEKVDPYLRPLYDALRDMIPGDQMGRLMQLGTLEIAPLAFMRGRTLNNAFVILDEAQNTSISQMKMFLTRLGANSKAVITGDITQVDLPSGSQSGLIHVQRILSHIEAIRFVQFTEQDVVRHALVQEIINAYDCYESAIQQELPLTDDLKNKTSENSAETS